MDVQTVKIDLIRWLTELQDKSVLQKLQGLKEEQENAYGLSHEQIKELDARLEKYEAGEMEFSTWNTAKERSRNRIKDAL